MNVGQVLETHMGWAAGARQVQIDRSAAVRTESNDRDAASCGDEAGLW